MIVVAFCVISSNKFHFLCTRGRKPTRVRSTTEPIKMSFRSTFDGTRLLGENLVSTVRSWTSDVSVIILTQFWSLGGKWSMMGIPINPGAPITSVRHRSTTCIRPKMIGEKLLISVQRIVLEDITVEECLSKGARVRPIFLHAKRPHSTHDRSLNVHQQRSITSSCAMSFTA